MDFDRLLAAGAVDFVQPSVAKMGGISELCKVFPLAAVHDVTLMPHCFYDGPGMLTTIHASTAPGSTDAMIELRCFDIELNSMAALPYWASIPTRCSQG
jgi:L-alanine-DL-glutamate epimerase-like enolase superfamily enzyme